MNRSLNDRIVTRHHFAKTLTTTETPAAGVDVKGMRQAEVMVSVGTMTNVANSPQPSWAFKLQHSDAAGSGFADVADTDVAQSSGNNDTIASGVFATVDAAAEDDKTYRIGYVGNKQYLRVVATAANTPGATPVSVVVIGEAMLAPGVDS